MVLNISGNKERGSPGTAQGRWRSTLFPLRFPPSGPPQVPLGFLQVYLMLPQAGTCDRVAVASTVPSAASSRAPTGSPGLTVALLPQEPEPSFRRNDPAVVKCPSALSSWQITLPLPASRVTDM